MHFLQVIEESIAVVHYGGPVLALLSIFVFELPRYLISTLSIGLFGQKADPAPSSALTISVIVPCFNGANGIVETILSVNRQRGQVIEIIFVDDGSTDQTLAVARRLKHSGLVTRVIHHTLRCGKSPAINHAARFAKGDLMLVIDCDTIIEGEDSIALLAAAFTDPSVAAASGNIRVRNTQDSLWSAFQGLEYLASITAGRSFLDIFDSVGCCSGAFSMFRRDVFLSAGGMNVGPGEDLEITLRLRQLGYSIRFVGAATALTNAPVTLSLLLRQRLRWDRDAVSVRLFMYRLRLPDLFTERRGDTLQRLDFMIFEFYPSVLLPFYIVYVLHHFGDDAMAFLIGVYVYLFIFYAINLVLIVILTRARITLFDGLALFGMPFYQGAILRTARLYAFVTEVFFSSSRQDDFVPERIRNVLYMK